jgi:predicted nucleotidyltransferase
MSHRENIIRIKAVHTALQELAQDVVFIGGATVSLYSTRPETETRPTDDVDIVVEVIHHREYAAIEKKLRLKGFVNDVESGVICRYTVKGITVDVMPTNEEILGFANKWYLEAFASSIPVELGEGITVRIFSGPYFIATKLEAFADRGENEGRFSSDFEDIVHVLNHRHSIWEEIKQSTGTLKEYLKDEFAQLLGQKYIDEWISVHLEHGEQKRVGFILANMNEIANS